MYCNNLLISSVPPNNSCGSKCTTQVGIIIVPHQWAARLVRQVGLNFYLSRWTFHVEENSICESENSCDCSHKIVVLFNLSSWAGPAMSSWATSYLYLDIGPPAYDRTYCRCVDIVIFFVLSDDNFVWAVAWLQPNAATYNNLFVVEILAGRVLFLDVQKRSKKTRHWICPGRVLDTSMDMSLWDMLLTSLRKVMDMQLLTCPGHILKDVLYVHIYCLYCLQCIQAM